VIPDEEVVLRVGAEGGSLTVYRVPSTDGQWYWEVETNEVATYDLLSEADDLDAASSVRRTRVRSLEDALVVLDKYPWVRLTPIQVHADYRDVILHAVFERGSACDQERWRAMLKRP
jgi:hypothetical protein